MCNVNRSPHNDVRRMLSALRQTSSFPGSSFAIAYEACYRGVKKMAASLLGNRLIHKVSPRR